MSKEYSFDLQKIKQLLPHRYPFLLVDKVLKMKPGTNPHNREGGEARVLKNVTANEPHFTGHFPNYGIMPGVLIIEAMAQASGLACYKEGDGLKNLILVSVKEAKFRRPVVPGDTLILIGKVLKDRGRMVLMQCRAEVNDQVVAEAELLMQVSPLGVEEVH